MYKHLRITLALGAVVFLSGCFMYQNRIQRLVDLSDGWYSQIICKYDGVSLLYKTIMNYDMEAVSVFPEEATRRYHWIQHRLRNSSGKTVVVSLRDICLRAASRDEVNQVISQDVIEIRSEKDSQYYHASERAIASFVGSFSLAASLASPLIKGPFVYLAPFVFIISPIVGLALAYNRYKNTVDHYEENKDATKVFRQKMITSDSNDEIILQPYRSAVFFVPYKKAPNFYAFAMNEDRGKKVITYYDFD